MILSPMFKFHLLVPAARADRGETGENRPVPGSGRGSRPLGHWAERERESGERQRTQAGSALSVPAHSPHHQHTATRLKRSQRTECRDFIDHHGTMTL